MQGSLKTVKLTQKKFPESNRGGFGNPTYAFHVNARTLEKNSTRGTMKDSWNMSSQEHLTACEDEPSRFGG